MLPKGPHTLRVHLQGMCRELAGATVRDILILAYYGSAEPLPS